MTASEMRASLTPPACRILDAMVWLETGRIPMPWHRSLVAYSATHLPSSGSYRAFLAALKALGLISYRGGPGPSAGLVLEHEGRELALSPERETGAGFSRETYWWLLDAAIGPVERAICGTLREPGASMRREVAIGGAAANAIAKLLAVGLVSVDPERGVYEATDVLRPLNVFEIREKRGESATDPDLEDPTT